MVKEEEDLVAQFLCLEEFGTHDWQPTTEWVQPTNHEGTPTRVGEYRTVKCSRCPAEANEARAPQEGVAEQVAALLESQGQED